MQTVVAARRDVEVRTLAERVGCAARVAALDELPQILDGIHTVASCLGPYTHVGAPVIEAAVRAGSNYLDPMVAAGGRTRLALPGGRLRRTPYGLGTRFP